MILIAYFYFPPQWMKRYVPIPTEAAIDSNYITPKKATTVSDKTKETKFLKSQTTVPTVSRARLTSYLGTVFAKYGIASELPTAEAVIACESGFQVDPPHNHISWGVAQFTPATWHDFGHGDIMNPYVQLDTMARMWTNPTLRLRWDCYRMIK